MKHDSCHSQYNECTNGNKCPVHAPVSISDRHSASQAVSTSTGNKLHLPSLSCVGKARYSGQATRSACSRRDERKNSTSADPMMSKKVRYLRGAGRLGQRGGMGRGEKYRDVYLRKCQRSPKASTVASSRQRWVPRESRSQVHPVFLEAYRSRVAVGILNQ